MTVAPRLSPGRTRLTASTHSDQQTPPEQGEQLRRDTSGNICRFLCYCRTLSLSVLSHVVLISTQHSQKRVPALTIQDSEAVKQ